MRYAFLGTPDFAATILLGLIKADMPPVLVICNPDRAAGRKKIVTPPPAKMIAEARGIKVWQPEKLEVQDFKKEVGDIDFAVVAAYAKIIKKEILDLPKKGFVGVHPSLLPRYRGASPIQSVLLEGEKETGVTLYSVDEKVDHGPILAQARCKIADNETYSTLVDSLAKFGADLLIKTLPEFARGAITPKAQNEAEATFTKKFKTEDALVNTEKDDPLFILRKIRALNPEPGAYAILNGKRTKLLEATKENGEVRITKTQAEGEKPKPAYIGFKLIPRKF